MTNAIPQTAPPGQQQQQQPPQFAPPPTNPSYPPPPSGPPAGHTPPLQSPPQHQQQQNLPYHPPPSPGFAPPPHPPPTISSYDGGYPSEKTSHQGLTTAQREQQQHDQSLQQRQSLNTPSGAPAAGQFKGAGATQQDDVGTFNGGSYRISHRDTNSILTLQLAVGCPIQAKPGKKETLIILQKRSFGLADS